MTVLISRNGYGGCRCRFRGLLVPLAPLPLMRCGGRGWCVGRMGDYQIAPKPPRGRLWQVAADAAGYGGTACGRDGEFYAAARLHLIRHGFAVPPVSLRVGRFADLTRHRRVIQHREPLEGKSNEDVFFDDISLVNGWYADLLCQHLDIPVAFRDTFW